MRKKNTEYFGDDGGNMVWCGSSCSNNHQYAPSPKYELKLEACVTYLLPCIEWVGMDGTRMESKPVRNMVLLYSPFLYGCFSMGVVSEYAYMWMSGRAKRNRHTRAPMCELGVRVCNFRNSVNLSQQIFQHKLSNHALHSCESTYIIMHRTRVNIIKREMRLFNALYRLEYRLLRAAGIFFIEIGWMKRWNKFGAKFNSLNDRWYDSIFI